MDRTTAVALTSRLLERVTTNTHDLADAPLRERVADFLSPERHELEVERFFLDTPQVVGFAGQVAEPNSFLSTEVLDLPILITRDREGTLRAFLNACAHRGARVAEGEGTAQRLTCRFHGWTFGLDGALAGRRLPDCFEPADASCGLTALPVSDRSGLLVVGVRPDMAPDVVHEHLAEIEDQFVGFGFDRMTTLAERRFDVAANWKLVTGVSCESYHFVTLHRDSVAQWLCDNAILDEFGPHLRWAFAMKGIERLADVDPADWPDQVPGAVSHVLFPGTVVITNGNSAQMIRTEPAGGPGRSHVRYLGVHGDPATRDAAMGSYAFGGDAFEQEDLVAVVESHKGLAAGRDEFSVGRNEAALVAMHLRWRDRSNP